MWRLQVCQCMEAVLGVITEQGLSPTPVAVFAAVLASLQHAATRQSAEVRSRRSRRLAGTCCAAAADALAPPQNTAAMCTVLAAALGGAAPAAVRSKLRETVTLLADVVAAGGEAPGVLRAALPCIGHALRCAASETGPAR